MVGWGVGAVVEMIGRFLQPVSGKAEEHPKKLKSPSPSQLPALTSCRHPAAGNDSSWRRVVLRG